MITFKKVTADDKQLNSKIDELNKKVFPKTESTENLHFLAGLHKGAPVDFIAVEDEGRFVGYTYMINFFQGSFIYYLAIEPDFKGKGYGSALLRHLRMIQGKRPIALTAFALHPDSGDYDECVRRKWFYVRNGYVDQKIPYPSNECHRYDIYLNGCGISYIELMAMLDKVNMLLNSLVCYGRINLQKPV